MPSYRLSALEGTSSYDLLIGRTIIVGRGAACDIALYDPTISRRHAQLSAEDGGIRLRDLGSSNGSKINGDRVVSGTLKVDDIVTFGKVQFLVESVALTGERPAAALPSGASEIVRELAVAPGRLQVDAAGAAGQLRVRGEEAGVRVARKLELLLELSQRLAGEFDLDRLLGTISDTMFEVMHVDRVSVLIRHPQTGEMVPRLARTRLGDAAPRQIPSSIAHRVAEERIAILTDNAAADTRFTGHSIVAQQVRSAMCSPLIGAAEQVHGLLYVDNQTAVNSFTDEDLQFLVAFSGIASMAIDNSRYADELQREVLVRSNFERYFAPNVAAEIARQSPDAVPGGERRPLSILFSDIRGFTSLAEQISPEEIARLLSDYFSEMVEIIFDYGGTLDKFIGDAIMALWGAPLAHEGDPDRAVEAARAMQRSLAELNERWTAEGRPRLEVGIGLNYGEAFAGNIGSPRRLEYTVIGDAVNIAARLCSIAGGGEILASAAMRDAVSSADAFSPAPVSSLRGKAAAVDIYRVRAGDSERAETGSREDGKTGR